MRNSLCAMVLSLVIIVAAKPASACMSMAKLDLEDIKYADVVVVGRIKNYEIVRSTDEYSEFLRNKYGQKDLLIDYARFNVSVDEVLVGQPPAVISVTWDNSTFGEPEKMKEEPYLIGLRKPGSKVPPLRGPSATILPSREPGSLTVLQAPCASAFIFEAKSIKAKVIREILDGVPKDDRTPLELRRESTLGHGDSIEDGIANSCLQKIVEVWNKNYPKEIRPKIYREAVVIFDIMSSGELLNQRISDAAGQNILAESILKSIKLASPCPGFPQEVKKRLDVISVIKIWERE